MSQISLTDNQYVFGGFEHALVIVIVGLVVFTLFQNTQLFTKTRQKLLRGLFVLLAIVYVAQYVFAVLNYTDNVRPFYEKEGYSRTGL